MDIGFIAQQYRDDVQRLTQICGITMEQAFSLFMECNCNLDNAINRQFNSPLRPLDQHRIIQQNQFSNSMMSEFDETDHAYQMYAMFCDNDIDFEKRYKSKILKKGNSRLRVYRLPQQLTFLQKLQNLIGHHSNLKIETKPLIDGLQKCWKQSLPFVIFNINFKCSDIADMKQFFKEGNEIQKILNEQFKLIGMDIEGFKTQQYPKELWILKQKVDSLVIGRINYIDEIEIISSIKITNDVEGMQKQVKKAKVDCIRRSLDESHIIKEHHQRRSRNVYYRRPKNYKEYIKAREDKKIREHQDKEFHQAVILKNKNQQRIQRQGGKQDKIAQQNSLNSLQIEQRRQQTRNKLIKYEHGLCFKIRLPSGQNILVYVDGSEKVQYLFDFIESYSSKLGFVDELNRNFDLFVGLGSTDTLGDKKSEKLNAIFEQPQTLIVREIET